MGPKKERTTKPRPLSETPAKAGQTAFGSTLPYRERLPSTAFYSYWNLSASIGGFSEKQELDATLASNQVVTAAVCQAAISALFGLRGCRIEYGSRPRAGSLLLVYVSNGRDAREPELAGSDASRAGHCSSARGHRGRRPVLADYLPVSRLSA